MREKIKTAVIVILFLLMAALAYFSLTLGMDERGVPTLDTIYRRLFSKEAPPEYAGRPGMIRPAAAPEKVCVRDARGLYMANHGEEKESLWQTCAPVCGEALGSMSDVSGITRETYLSYLKSELIYVSYDCAFPLSMLCAWLGVEQTEISPYVLSSYIVMAEQEQVKIAFYDVNEKTYYEAVTAANPQRLRDSLGAQAANAVFAFESGNFASFDGAEPVLLSAQTLKALTGEPISFVNQRERPKEIVSAFSINPYLAKIYSKQETVVYVEGFTVLSMSPDGQITYTASGSQGIELEGSAETDEARRLVRTVEDVRAFADKVWKILGADGTLSLCYCGKGETGAEVYSFDILVSGVAVADQAGATIAVHSGRISSAVFSPMRFTEGDDVRLLPYKQASFALGQKDVRPCVRYILKDGLYTPAVCYLTGGES